MASDSDQVRILADGCPPDMEKFAFDIEVHAPDLDSTDVTKRKTGWVDASYGSETVGYLYFGFVGDDVMITSIKTAAEFRCRGCARQMFDSLVAHFPDRAIRDGGNSNDEVGDFVLGRWREQGILNDL